jgi:hypothetical protein
LRLERPLRLEAWLESANAETTRELLASTQASLSFDSNRSAQFPVTDWGAERALLARAKVEAGTGKSPIILTFMELAELDEGLAWIANRIERQLSRPGPAG